MSISFNGLGSGLAVSDIVDALVNAEQAPAEARLDTKENNLTTDISAVGALKSALEKVQDSMANLGDVDNYQKREISGEDDFISLTSDKNAQPGSYSVKVNSLATEHKVLSQAFDPETAVGEGTMTLTSGENSFDIEVSDTATLSEIRDAINDSDDNDSVNATIITDDEGQHLVFSAKNSGAENEIKIEVNDADGDNINNNGLSRLAFDSSAGIENSEEVIQATDASITIDGRLTVSSSSNTFDDVIDGITITVNKSHSIDDDVSNLSVTENNDNIEEGLNSFIESYNELLNLSNTLGSSTADGAGVMAGDSLLRGVMSKLRSEITESIDLGNGDSLSLLQLGVSSDQYGVLSFDKEKLDEQLENDVDLVQKFFIGDAADDDDLGFAGSFDDLMNFYTRSDGLIQSRIDSKEGQLRDIDDERDALTRKIESLSSRLYAQYNAMDLLVASLNSTSSYVQAQLENMPGVVSSN
jgi:flagellar hook-associated protein 2